MNTSLKPLDPLYRGFAIKLHEAARIEANAPLPADRASVVDVGLPLRVRLSALADGHLVFDFDANPDYCGGAVSVQAQAHDLYFSDEAKARYALVDKRAKYMNAFLSTLYEGGQQAQIGLEAQPPVTSAYYMDAKNDGARWELYGPSAFPGDKAIPALTFERSAEIFEAVHRRYGDKALELLALLHVACVHYTAHAFSSCLAIGWSVVEGLLVFAWRERPGNATRKLPVAAKMTKDLGQAGVLDAALVSALNGARVSRNEFIHELKPVPANLASVPLALAAQIIGAAAGC